MKWILKMKFHWPIRRKYRSIRSRPLRHHNQYNSLRQHLRYQKNPQLPFLKRVLLATRLLFKGFQKLNFRRIQACQMWTNQIQIHLWISIRPGRKKLPGNIKKNIIGDLKKHSFFKAFQNKSPSSESPLISPQSSICSIETIGMYKEAQINWESTALIRESLGRTYLFHSHINNINDDLIEINTHLYIS